MLSILSTIHKTVEISAAPEGRLQSRSSIKNRTEHCHSIAVRKHPDLSITAHAPSRLIFPLLHPPQLAKALDPTS